MKRVPHAECEFPIFGVTLIPTGGSLSRKYPLTPVGGGLEWDSWARIWPPPKGSATAPEVGFEEIIHLISPKPVSRLAGNASGIVAISGSVLHRL